MSNEGLKPESFEDKKITESLLLEEIKNLKDKNDALKEKNSKLEKQNNEWEEKFLKLEKGYKKLERDLIHDHLTGLKTRKYFEERVEEIIPSLKSSEHEERKEGFHNLGVLFCDIDNFKKINDTLGHKGGDMVLKRVSEIITSSVRTSDVVSRWGGEEIVVGLFGADEEETVEKAEGIRIAIEEGMKDMNATISIGVAFYKEGLDMDSIIKQGDEAMYFAKSSGKNNVKTYIDIPKNKAK
ncbi:MAG: ggdef domain protein [Parcubacteria group bacterium]|nr:ggdef domain protein [Parcubacteria group bacterium]